MLDSDNRSNSEDNSISPFSELENYANQLRAHTESIGKSREEIIEEKNQQKKKEKLLKELRKHKKKLDAPEKISEREDKIKNFFQLPTLNIPKIHFPKVEFPKIEIPEIKVPTFEMPKVSDLKMLEKSSNEKMAISEQKGEEKKEEKEEIKIQPLKEDKLNFNKINLEAFTKENKKKIKLDNSRINELIKTRINEIKKEKYIQKRRENKDKSKFFIRKEYALPDLPSIYKVKDYKTLEKRLKKRLDNLNKEIQAPFKQKKILPNFQLQKINFEKPVEKIIETTPQKEKIKEENSKLEEVQQKIKREPLPEIKIESRVDYEPELYKEKEEPKKNFEEEKIKSAPKIVSAIYVRKEDFDSGFSSLVEIEKILSLQENNIKMDLKNAKNLSENLLIHLDLAIDNIEDSLKKIKKDFSIKIEASN